MSETEDTKEPIFGYEQTGTFRKNIAGILDAVIVLFLAAFGAFLLILQKIVEIHFDLAHSWIYFFIIFVLYRLISIFITSSTIGMLIMKTRYERDKHESIYKGKNTCCVYDLYKWSECFQFIVSSLQLAVTNS